MCLLSDSAVEADLSPRNSTGTEQAGKAYPSALSAVADFHVSTGSLAVADFGNIRSWDSMSPQVSLVGLDVFTGTLVVADFDNIHSWDLLSPQVL